MDQNMAWGDITEEERTNITVNIILNLYLETQAAAQNSISGCFNKTKAYIFDSYNPKAHFHYASNLCSH